MSIPEKSKKEILNRAYPVGCYYFSNENKSPATWIGGNWTKVTGGFLKPTTSGSGTGGSSTYTVSKFAPSHTHSVGSHTHTLGSHSHTLSTSHGHSVGSHSHSAASNNHRHGFYGSDGPPGTPVYNDTSGLIYPHFGGGYNFGISGTSTNETTVTNFASSSTPSQTANSDYASSTKSNSSSLSSEIIWTDYTGSGSSQSINIMPPYIACYCWRRDS